MEGEIIFAGYVSIHATLAGGDAAKAEHEHYRVENVSIHATLAGGDFCSRVFASRLGCFYPRHPRGWRPVGESLSAPGTGVSIHATLAGGDASASAAGGADRRVSIHATLAGGDVPWISHSTPAATFLSTPPSRVATSKVRSSRRSRWCFYPRHPRGWRQHARDRVFHRQFVSIHATLAGGDRRNAADH